MKSNKYTFDILAEGLSEGVIIVDEKQNIVVANSALEQMFGYKKSDLQGQNLEILIPKSYHHNHKGHFENFFAHSEKRQMGGGRNLYGQKKNGETFPVEVSLNPFTISKKTFVMALIMDITERRETEKNFRIQSAAMQSAVHGILITDAQQDDHPIIYFNPAFANLTGYSEEDILNKNCRFLQGDDRDQKSIKVMSNAIKEGIGCQVVLRNYKKDGTLFWNELTITPIHDKTGIVTHFVGIQNDVTQRKNSEDEQAHWAKIFDESLNEIYIFDAKSLRFVDVNYGAQKNMGYSLDEFKELTPVDIKPEYTETQFQEVIAPLVKEIGKKIEFETVHQRKDGTTYPVEVHLQSSSIGGRQVLVAIILDITERKNYTQKLERTVEERTKQLRKALAKEKEISELKTKFLSLVSHEFKTPLTGIGTSSILARKYTQTEQQEKREKHFDTIDNKVKYLNNILNDFLSIERLQSGKVNYKFSTFPLSKVINEVVYNANMQLKSGQKINYPNDVDEITIDFEEKILELTLANLVNNAIKYSPENTNINIEVQVKGELLLLEVSDQGIGIPKKEQKFVFDRYFRAKNALLNQGTGIGLNIVKSHLENLGGSISFISEENEGSTFTANIPITNNQ